MLVTPQDYTQSLSSPGKNWLIEFMGYMQANHGNTAPVMFRQRPMYKFGKSYILFTVAKTHFTVHTLNFELIEALKPKLPSAAFGKGSVKVKFSDTGAKPLLKQLCDEVARLNSLPNPPPVDVVRVRPYEENLDAAFPGGKAKWLPLYKTLHSEAKQKLPPFVEYFPAINVLWKHKTTFAQISAVAGALRVEFYASAPHPECAPVKILQTSKNRVAHTVEITTPAQLGDVIGWVAQSYTLTLGRSNTPPKP